MTERKQYKTKKCKVIADHGLLRYLRSCVRTINIGFQCLRNSSTKKVLTKYAPLQVSLLEDEEVKISKIAPKTNKPHVLSQFEHFSPASVK